jgi:hypothetical protein
MCRSLTVFLLFAASVFCTNSAYAQDTRSFGVTMGYPASIGVLWHLSEGVAVRPELSFDFFSTETENDSPLGGDSSQDGHNVSVGLSALFYFARWDMTRAAMFTTSASPSAHSTPWEIGSPSTGSWASRTNGPRLRSARPSCAAPVLARAAASALSSTSDPHYRPSGIPGRGAEVGGTD